MKKYTIKEFAGTFKGIDFSLNVRNQATDYEGNSKTIGLAQAMLETKGNADAITVATLNGATVIVRGYRRAFIFLNPSLIFWEEKVKNEKSGKMEAVIITPDFSECTIAVEDLGKITEADFFSRLCDHGHTLGLDRYGQIQSVERLYRSRRGDHSACKQIQNLTGLSRAIVTQSIKAIELDSITTGFLQAYIDGNVKTAEMNEVFPAVTKANQESGKVRIAMLDEVKAKCKEVIDSKDEPAKTEKALSRKAMLALRDTVKGEFVALVEYIAGCADSSIKSYLK